MGRDDPLAALVALGAAPSTTTFEGLLEASRGHVQRLVPSNSMNAQRLDRARAPVALYEHGLPPNVLRDYVLEYWKTDPMVVNHPEVLARSVTLAGSARPGELRRNPYWNELTSPAGIHDVLGVSYRLPGGDLFQIACQRGAGAIFAPREQRRFEVAGAEIVRAVTALALRQAPSTDGTAGVLLFDPTGVLLHADEGAGPLFAKLVALGRGPWLASSVREQASRARAPHDRLATVSLGRGAELKLRFSLAHGLADARVVAVGASLALDPSEAAAAAAQRLGLTPREVAVCSLVARGLANREIAHALGVRAVTVRDHLRRIFAAVRVGSRTELVSRLLSAT